MILKGLHEKEIFTEQYPFRLIINNTEEFQYPLHWHNAAELVYNTSGYCRIDVSGTEYMLSDGDLLLIPSGEIHEITASSKGGERVFVQFDISSLDCFGGINNIRPYMNNTVRISKASEPELQLATERCVLDLISEYEKKDYAYALFLNARIFDIVVLVSRHLATKEIKSGLLEGSRKISGLKQIDRAFEYIEKNYPSEITLKDVSNFVGFSEYYFSRLFKDATGQNFLNYLNGYRARQAEKLLKHSDKPVLDIALESGFNSLATFNRTFRRIRGCSPTFYRKACM
ncbi:MAG TPA: AraC family transcriptional regulator [Clostridia bacterium]|nr:AraC family transcriptional regulator [Clostridia bacterium]